MTLTSIHVYRAGIFAKWTILWRATPPTGTYQENVYQVKSNRFIGAVEDLRGVLLWIEAGYFLWAIWAHCLKSRG